MRPPDPLSPHAGHRTATQPPSEPTRCLVTRNASPMELVADGAGLPESGLLMHGRRATAFASFAEARSAILRTWGYARQKRYDWGQLRPRQWQIWPVADTRSPCAPVASVRPQDPSSAGRSEG